MILLVMVCSSFRLINCFCERARKIQKRNCLTCGTLSGASELEQMYKLSLYKFADLVMSRSTYCELKELCRYLITALLDIVWMNGQWMGWSCRFPTTVCGQFQQKRELEATRSIQNKFSKRPESTCKNCEAKARWNCFHIPSSKPWLISDVLPLVYAKSYPTASSFECRTWSASLQALSASRFVNSCISYSFCFWLCPHCSWQAQRIPRATSRASYADKVEWYCGTENPRRCPSQYRCGVKGVSAINGA